MSGTLIKRFDCGCEFVKDCDSIADELGELHE